MKEMSDPEKAEKKAKKFNIRSENALGLYQRDINELAKEIGKNEDLALALFDCGYYEGKLLCAKTFPVQALSDTVMDKWVLSFDNWEIVDTFSMVLFAKYEDRDRKISEWKDHPDEFIRRTAYATIAGICSSDKKSPNTYFEKYYPWCLEHSDDHRNYVKKAISWALRSIGKRNIDLLDATIEIATEMMTKKDASSQWIAKDVLAELSGDKVRISDYPRSIYRPK